MCSMCSFADYSFTLIEDNWVAYNGNEYFFGNTTMTMEKARKFCKDHRGDLAVVNDETEWKFLWRYVRKIFFPNQIYQ